MVDPITYFPSIRYNTHAASAAQLEMRHSPEPLWRRNVDPELLAACATISPTYITKLYNIDYIPITSPASGSRLAIAGFLEQ
jgi:hypothetical protein